MKRTTMFILTLAFATFLTGYAHAQYFYYPWAGYQCANGRCNRTAKPAQVKTAEPAEPQVEVVELKPFCQQVIELVNQARARYGLPALIADTGLSNGCANHSRYMASYGFGHAYNAGAMECIAMGVRTPEAVVNMWLNSSGHRAILLGSGRIIGVGFSGVYWTLRVR